MGREAERRRLFSMSSDSPKKRASPASDDTPGPAKRQRTQSSSTANSAESPVAAVLPTRIDGPPNFNEQHRMELRRAITLALGHVGFDSASEEALESFTHMTETCQFAALSVHDRHTWPLTTDK